MRWKGEATKYVSTYHPTLSFKLGLKDRLTVDKVDPKAPVYSSQGGRIRLPLLQRMHPSSGALHRAEFMLGVPISVALADGRSDRSCYHWWQLQLFAYVCAW